MRPLIKNESGEQQEGEHEVVHYVQGEHYLRNSYDPKPKTKSQIITCLVKIFLFEKVISMLSFIKDSVFSTHVLAFNDESTHSHPQTEVRFVLFRKARPRQSKRSATFSKINFFLLSRLYSTSMLVSFSFH